MEPLSQVQAGIEAAALALEDPSTRVQAEAQLLEFRRSPSLFPACQHILAHSSVPAAQLQAVLALRQAALLGWPRLEASVRVGLTRFLLDQALGRARDPARLLRHQCGAVAAQLLKRGHQDTDWGDLALASLVRGVAAKAGGEAVDPAERATCLELLAALAAEFNPPTATAMGQPWAWHDRARLAFEREAVPAVAACALGQARAAADALVSAPADAAMGALVLRALDLLGVLAGWEFRSGRDALLLQVSGQLGDRPGEGDGRGRAQALLPDLHAALSSPGALDWVPRLGELVSNQTMMGPSGQELGGALRCFLLQLAHTTPPQGTPPGQGPSLACRALGASLRLWALPPGTALRRAAAGDEDGLLDACRMALAVAGTAPAAWVAAAAAGDEALQPGALAELTCAVLEAGAAHGDLDWPAEAGRLLLDTWAALAPRLGEAEAAAAGAVYSAALREGLASAERGAFEEEDEAAETAEAASAAHASATLAAVGRGAGAGAATACASAIEHACAALSSCVESEADPSVPLEQLCWLLQAAAALLADEPSADEPAPEPPLRWSAGAADAAAARELAGRLLGVARLCTSHAGRPGISPRLVETACDALGRWAAAYFPSAPDADAEAEAALRLARAALDAYPGEMLLHKKACKSLLGGLVARRDGRRVAFRAGDWLALCGQAAAQQVRTGPHVARAMLRALVAAAGGAANETDARAYVLRLLSGPVRDLGEAARAPKEALWRGDASAHVLFCLESLRGGVEAAEPASAPALVELAGSAAGPLAQLLPLFHGHLQVTVAILKLAACIGEHLLPLTTQAETLAGLSHWALNLLRAYSKDVKGVVDMGARQQDGYRDLKAFLKLLAAVLRGGVTDGEPAAELEIVQAVTGGLQAVLPLLPANLPAHPKLCLSFFDILAYLYETFPGAVAALAPGDWAGLAGMLFQGLEFASAGPATTQILLEATSALAGYRAQALLSGGGAAGPAAGAPGNVPGAVPWAGPTLTPLGALACRLLCRLVLVERGADVVAVASSSLLPLLITEGAGLVEATRDELVKHVSEPELQELISQACQQLLQDRPAGLDHRSKNRFQIVLQRFVEMGRSIIQRN